MDRPRKKINRVLTVGLFLLTLLASCGQRSGIHNDNEQIENAVVTDNKETTEKAIDVWYSEEDGRLFKKNCAVCHSLTDQTITGPGMAGIRDRIPQPAEEWFVKYTLNSEKVLASGDPYAAKLKDEYKGNPMPAFEGVLTEQEIKTIFKVVAFRPSQALP